MSNKTIESYDNVFDIIFKKDPSEHQKIAKKRFKMYENRKAMLIP